MALTGPKSKRTFGPPPFEPHGKGLFVLYRNPQIGHTQYVCIRPDGLVGETRALEQACRFRSSDWAAAFVLASKGLSASDWHVGRRPPKEE